MKKMKKLLSMLLTVIMVLAMTAPSFAEETKGSITINNPIKGQTYSIYKIFSLESYDGGNYSYKVVNEWSDFIKDYSEYFTINDSGYLTENTLTDNIDFDRANFAKAALKYAEDKGITTVGEPVTAGEDETVIFSNIDLGYYLVDSSAGALCALDTAKPNMQVNEKNEAPTIEKKRVYETGEDDSDSSVSVGDVVNYSITITAKAGAQNYVVHDAMTGLSFKELTKVTKNGEDVAEADYSYTTENVDGCAFELNFKEAFYQGLNANDKIIIEYSATVTKAAIQENKATNTATLQYGTSENITDETPKSTVESPTYKFGLMKTRTDGTLLENAEFTLYEKDTNTGDYTQIFVIYDETHKYYRKAVDGETSQNIKAGKVVIAGLGNGTYGLKEESAPTGFNKLDGYSDVIINNSDNLVNTADSEAYKEGDGGIQIVNNVGTLLPSTGGIGTTIFYAAGIILMAGAVFFVVRRKRA